MKRTILKKLTACLCLCAVLALLVLAFVAAGLTLRQRAQRAQ